MESMARVLLDRSLTEVEWDALLDPDGGRYEILNGRLVMSASGNAHHGRFGEDLAEILRSALFDAGVDLPVTIDIEWRTVAQDVVTQAPRGDVVVGRSLDPDRLIHNDIPLLVAEVWSKRTMAATRTERRAYWSSLGLRHYWEILLDDQPDDAAIEIWDLGEDAFPMARAVGAETVSMSVPFPVDITPSLIHGWAQRQKQRADEATARADRLAARLREHGLDDT